MSPLPRRKETDFEQRFTVSRTTDRGHTWQKECAGKGTCLEIAENGDKLFLLTKRRKKGAQEDSLRIWRTPVAKFRPKAILRTVSDIYGFHAFDENTYICLQHLSECRISYLLTTDGGKNWETHNIPGMALGKQVSYSGTNMLIPLLGGLYVKDIASNKANFFKYRNFMAAFMAGQIIVSQDMKFWKYDGKSLKNISGIKLDKLILYAPESLMENDGMLIGHGRDCLFFSTDGGYNWDISKQKRKINEIASIKCDEGAAVIYTQDNDSMLHFMKIRQDTGEKHNRRNAGKRLRPSKNIPDSLDTDIVFNLIFGRLIDFYEDNIPGFKMPEMNNGAQQTKKQ